MVRMVAITASFEMSSQVGATAVRKISAARANSSPSNIQVAKRSQICRPFNPVAWPLAIALNRAAIDCKAPKATTNGAALYGETHVARDQTEFAFERRVQPPAPRSDIARPCLHIVKRTRHGPQARPTA